MDPLTGVRLVAVDCHECAVTATARALIPVLLFQLGPCAVLDQAGERLDRSDATGQPHLLEPHHQRLQWRLDSRSRRRFQLLRRHKQLSCVWRLQELQGRPQELRAEQRDLVPGHFLALLRRQFFAAAVGQLPDERQVRCCTACYSWCSCCSCSD